MTQFWRDRWQQFVALLILINLVLVGFDLSYLSLRPFYLQQLPALVTRYDPIKGVMPHPVTQDYLAQIAQLRQQLATEQPVDNLSLLQDRSITLIEENPYAASGQLKTFARLKRRLRGYTDTYSAQAAFRQLWQSKYIAPENWPDTDKFLKTRIEPLLRQAYFRKSTVGGRLVDQFWRIDLPFVILFGLDLALRTAWIARQKQIFWGNAILRRWYELPLLLPFFRWLRIVPAVIRIHRTNLLNLDRLATQLTHEPIAYLSDKAAKYTVAQVLTQSQDVVRSGAVFSALTQPDDRIDRLADGIVRTLALQVLPVLQPDLESLLRYGLKDALTDSVMYDALKTVPGFSDLSDTVLAPLADTLARATCTALADAYSDTEGRQLIDQLSDDFRLTLVNALQQEANKAEVQMLVIDLIETVKQNYVEQAQQANSEAMLAQVNQLEATTTSS